MLHRWLRLLYAAQDLECLKQGDDQKAGVEIVKGSSLIRQITANAGVDGSVVVVNFRKSFSRLRCQN